MAGVLLTITTTHHPATDLGYLLVGWWLAARAARPNLRPFAPARLLGYGRSLWVQGGFLLVFDALMAWIVSN